MSQVGYGCPDRCPVERLSSLGIIEKPLSFRARSHRLTIHPGLAWSLQRFLKQPVDGGFFASVY